MTNIHMAIRMLKISRSPESTAQYLNILQSECTREVELINDLLDLQRLEAGAQTFDTEEIHLANWLPPLIEPFYERAEVQDQTLYMEVEPQLPTLNSDQASLERVLVELVNNACKYTPPHGEIKVTASSTPFHVILCVSNSGTPIPQAELPRIFEKFYRVPQADSWRRGGTGLGLALVKKLVEALGGTIQVESNTGSTTFMVQFPLPHCDR
jgi:signal transduction histidine kinase